MIAINFNILSGFHWDNSDKANCFCVLVALGDYEGGELCFPQLKVVIQLKPGQVVAFRSRLLLHGNCVLTKGIRHSIVYYVHHGIFRPLQSKAIDKVYENFKIERNNKNKIISKISKQNLYKAPLQNSNRHQSNKPKAWQINTPSSSSGDQR